MRFIIRMKTRRMEQGKLKTPVVESIRKHVLYDHEACDVMERYIPSLGDDWYFPYRFRIVKRKETQDFYWTCDYHDVQYAVKIGAKSEFFAVPKSDFAKNFEEIPMSMTIEIPLKVCSAQTREDTMLSLSMLYDADEKKILLQTLNLTGTDIRDFPHDYWKIYTVSDACGKKISDGCYGKRCPVTLSETPEMDLGGLKIFDATEFWSGFKTLKVFTKADEGYTIDEMLDDWENFWKAFGY